ncbi:MAG TPA: helix-turn-helix transcriptional regulator [Bryobacteraceae bacterium]|jgi:DNA-binding CsgD family transcriptional regulator|nr:helix-turn-helix transcriptional regulator [Bryobacteraceae bacterium]
MPDALEIIGLIYDAVADASLWQKVLDTFIQATQGIGGSLFVGDPRMDAYAFVRRYRMSEEEAALYFERYAASDGWALRVAGLPEGFVGASHDIWSEDDMLKSPAYQGFYGPRNWHYGMGGIFLRTSTGVSAMTMLREKEKGPCGEPEMALLRTLLPHLRRAALLHSELTSLRSQRAVFLVHLDRYPQAFLLIDAERRLLVANTPGREILGLRDGFRLEGGQIRLAWSKEDSTLREVVREIAINRESPVSRLSVTRPSQASPYRLLLMPVPSFGAAPLGISQPAVAMVIINDDGGFSPDTSALSALFSLTPAEVRVTSLLVQGRSTEEIATELGVSLETVRTHVRRVFSKTATNRQGELIALVLRSVPFERL